MVIKESDALRLYGSKSCVKSQIVRFCRTEESFSGVLRMGDVWSIEGLCSDLFSVCTI